MASLSLKNICKVYPNGFEAVKDFNLEVEDKEFIIFVGPSGCGKSTTLRMIAGLEEISSGELIIDGKVMNDVEPKDRDIAMVFQNYALYPHMTVFDNMAFGLKLRKVPKDEIKAKVEEAARILDLEKLLDRKPKALSGGHKRVSDDEPVDITKLPEDDKGLYYKDEPYTTKKLHQRLIITYSPKYALYQKSIRDTQVERAQKMLDSGKAKRNRKNPNDPARFIGKKAVTKDGEAADIKQYLDEDKIAEEAQYDGLYAVCTDLLDDEVGDILKVSEGRWQIEECFRIMKTDFSARPIYLREENRIKAHFLICFLALTVYRYLEKKLDSRYTCEELLDTLKAMNFAGIQEQGFIPLYRREKITDDLHEACGFRTDYQFITSNPSTSISRPASTRCRLSC